MFVEAIVNENIDREFLILEIGNRISGNARSYKQNFIKVYETIEVDYDYNELGEITNGGIKEVVTKVMIKENSIKKVECGCGKLATREICSEYLCDECEYEEPEDFSYLSQTPWESD
jgi:hypothetical protein